MKKKHPISKHNIKYAVSVFIISQNEEERLPNAIDSVKDWCEEIILVDSGSTDKTLEIAESYRKNCNIKIFHNDWQGFGAQKIFGEQKCSNDWVLNIDADEAISPELKNDICKLFDNEEIMDHIAYRMKWKLIFFGQSKPPLFAAGSNVIRLYNKKHCGFRDSKIHDSVIPKDKTEFSKGDIGFLDGIILHRCFKNYKHWIEKVNYYTTEQAEDWLQKGRAMPSKCRIFFEPITSFFKSYILRKYCFYGLDGFYASLIYAFSKMLRLAKVKELYIVKNLEDKKN